MANVTAEVKAEKVSSAESAGGFLPYHLPIKRVKLYIANARSGAERSVWRGLLREMQAKRRKQ
jgi:hypothetical protein